MPDNALAPPLLAGRYRLLDKLGEGGMGVVYKAHDEKLDRDVAIKIMAAHLVSHPDAITRFHREAKALAKLSHPGIVQAHDADESDGQHFLVMEFVNGPSLAQLVRDKGRIAPTTVADYGHQASLALQHAHDRGLVHRDVKPQNLLLGPGSQVKVLDLGLARFAQDHLGDATLTREGAGMGTPEYVSPEQFASARRADRRSDVYSLGCTLFYLVTGRVPFPGSSLEEKIRAHEEQEPPRIGELCPETPIGLAATIHKMMAKKPSDRFQSMQEVAEALAPYVASSSMSLPALEKTSRWEGSHLSFSEMPTKTGDDATVGPGATLTHLASDRKRVVGWTAAVGAGVVAAGLLLTALFFKPWEVAEPNQPLGQVSNPPAKKPKFPTDPDVLTVSQKEEEGGQYRTINEALAKVKPYQTIRVLDDATYKEGIHMQGTDRFKGVTLEASKGATIEAPPSMKVTLMLMGMTEVSVRGFRISLVRPDAIGVGVAGISSALRIDGVSITSSANSTVGVLFQDANAPEKVAPIIVENCIASNHFIACQITGNNAGSDVLVPRPCRGIVVRNNRFHDSNWGIALGGRLNDIVILGNQVWNCVVSLNQALELMDGSGDVQITNNTFMSAAECVSIGNLAGQLGTVEILNNLILSKGSTDVVFVGKDRRPLSNFRIAENWRQVRPATSETTETSNWIDGKNDQIRDKIELLSTDPVSPDFLRPAKDSPLATEGAGMSDPRLPTYVGAVPPEGVTPWDWDRAWRMPKNAQLLTVSKEEKVGGKYRTINEALKEAKPWATIRVLDDAAYQEELLLEDAAKHQGVTLEAMKRATLELPPNSFQILAIRNVSGVCIRGFQIRGGNPEAPKALITLTNEIPGTTLEGLEVTANGPTIGIALSGVRGTANEPVRIRRCRLTGAAKGVLLLGDTAHVQFTSNIVRNCKLVALQFEDLASSADDLLVANNTVISNTLGLRIFDSFPYEQLVSRRIEIGNNLFLDAGGSDVAYVLWDGKSPAEVPGDSRSLFEHWNFHDNRRDLSGTMPHLVLPLAPRDRRPESTSFLSREPNDPDFLRPAPDSPLATGGAGQDDPSLPIFVGAIPPKGTPPWDWDRTWRWRARTARVPSSSAP